MIKKFLMLFLPISVLLGVVFFLFYLSDIKSRERLIAYELKAQINIQSNAIVYHFKTVVSDLAILSELHELRQMADNLEDFSPEELEDDFLSISLRKGLYDQIRFIRDDGQEVLRVNYNNGRPLLTPGNQLENKTDRYYFKEIMALAREETYISPLDLNIERGEIERPLKPVIRFGTPILNSKGEKRGILLLNFLAKPTIEEFKNGKHLLPGQQDSLLNSEGYWLAGPKAENEWGFMLRERKEKTFGAAHPGSWKRVLSKDTGQFQTDEGFFTFTTLYPLLAIRDSKGLIGKAYSVSLPDAKTFFWKIVSFVPTEALNNASHVKSSKLRDRLAKLYAVILLITGFGTFFFILAKKKREMAEEALSGSEQKFHAIMQSVTDAIISTNTKGQIITWNRAAETIFGYSEDEALSQPITTLIPERYKEQHHRVFEQAIFTGKLKKPGETIEVAGIRKDGSEFPLEISLSSWEMGGILSFTSISRDITKRKQVETELESYRSNLENIVEERTRETQKSLADAEEARDRIDGILKSVADGLIVTDIHNRVVLMNRAAENLFNIRQSEVINQHINLTIQDSTLTDKIVEILDKKTTTYTFNFKLPTDDPKKPMIMRGTTAVILDKDGNQTGIVTLMHDITQEREIDRMKTEFISTAAHELRTPLTSIQGFSEILLVRDNLTPEEKNKFIGYINKQAVGLGKIINDLLDISRIESGHVFKLNKVLCNSGDAIKQIVPYFEKQPGFIHKFEVKLPDREVLLYVDKEKMGQALKNIISNAIKYSPKGGVIKIHTAVINNEYRISVEDEGLGMTPDQLKQIFNKFYRVDSSDTAVEGTGLGMSIVKYIIEAHGGEVCVESEFGKGTKVHFTLPVADKDKKI